MGKGNGRGWEECGGQGIGSSKDSEKPHPTVSWALPHPRIQHGLYKTFQGPEPYQDRACRSPSF